MLKLITFPPGLGLNTPSPFTMKADMLLAISGVPYERVFGDIRKAPRGKLPVLKDGSKIISDTSLIQRYLEDEKAIDFDSHLSDQQRALATAFQRLIEQHLYFINVHFRWNEHGDAVRDNLFGAVPALIRGMVFKSIQKGIGKTLHLQGLGRFDRDELIEFGTEDIRAIATHLGKNPYFMGKKISAIDASLYGALHGLIDCELDTPVKTEALKHQNLVAYCARIAEEYPYNKT